jgi:ferritin-like metal-binding protein YciE
MAPLGRLAGPVVVVPEPMVEFYIRASAPAVLIGARPGTDHTRIHRKTGVDDAMPEPNARDLKLIQYLNEAYGKERELETALQAHIGMTTRPPYKKRLREHLKETKAHARTVERRIKQLGGKADAGPAAEAASTLQTVASKAVAAAQGPLHAIRGTGENEKMLKNAKSEYSHEFEEIATYTGIESLAEAVGDKETAKLARGIRREEERMAKFLERQIPALAKGVAREEVPAAERRTARRSTARRGTRRRTSAAGSTRARSAARASGSSSSAARAGRATTARSAGGGRASRSRSS